MGQIAKFEFRTFLELKVTTNAAGPIPPVLIEGAPIRRYQEICSEQLPVRRDFVAPLAGMAAFSGAAVAKSNMDTTLLKSAKLELRIQNLLTVASGLFGTRFGW
jgi:hypothetical protein